MVHHINILKNEKHESHKSLKAFDKIQNSFMIKKETLSKLGLEEPLLNTIKTIYEKPQLESYGMGKS